MTFAAGDLVLLVDRRGRRYLFTLTEGGEFHSHAGPFPHDAVIGSDEGVEVSTTHGKHYRAFRPTLDDFVLKMPRGATVVYPKDIGPILVYADIFPGARVLEAGTGSGALTIALLRAVGPKGSVHTFDVREDFHKKAVANVERFIGSDPNCGALDARVADVYTDGTTALDVDRVVFDLTEPWRALPFVERSLRPGGILCCYLPTIPQVERISEALRGGWAMVKTFETLQRGWTVDGLSVRPDHRMVAHTGFLVVARRVPQ